MSGRPPGSFGPDDPSDAEVIRRARRKVLEGIAYASSSKHTTIHAGADGWQPFLDGVRCKVLNEAANVLSYLLWLEPGAVLPAHRHPIDEECIVLEGELRMGDTLVMRAGDYHLGRAGVLHAPITSDTGALVFLRGAPPDASTCL